MTPQAHGWVRRGAEGILLATIVGLSACSSGGEKPAASNVPPSVVLLDAQAHTKARARAAGAAWDEVERGAADRLVTREQLKKVIWARSTFVDVRIAALDALLRDQEGLDDTRNMLALMLPTETIWPMIDRICKVASERRWTPLAPALVRSWSRQVPTPTDDERPERAALVELFPERPVEDTIYAVFAGDPSLGEALRERDRMDAWALLRRVDPKNQRTLALLSQSQETDDQLLGALQAGARELHAVPESSEQLAWLKRLRGPDNQTFWNEASSAIAKLNAQQTQDFALRHVSVVRWVAAHAPERLSRTRDELLSELERKLDGRRMHFRSAGNMGGFPLERLREHRDKLSWGDIVSFLTAMDIMEQPPIVSALFLQADRDLNDRSTEHGGVLTENVEKPGTVTAVHFAPRPMQRQGDTMFTPSQDMIDAGDTALFQYHFHCTSYTNSDYAGPSTGDIETAQTLGRNSLVFTFINRETLNVDYYDGRDVRLDLGDITRPTKGTR